MFFSKKSAVSTDENKVDELLSRSVTELIPGKEELKKLLLSGKQLRIKLGIDPTSPNLHIGRAVTLLKLRDFQELGHKIVFIVGDFTAVIGDTSDKDSERPMLSTEEIEKNKTTYFEQAGKILDISLVEKKRNSEWLSKLTYREIGEHADLFSVADFIARDNIKRRLDAGKRVSLREVMYPLMQGYDSVAVEADIEIGGTDQRFNLLAGRPLQERYKQHPQSILTTELILGTDGRKMSSSWGNTINLTDSKEDMYGKTMSIPDELIESYFVHCTRVPLEKVTELMARHPKEAKMALGFELVRMYHGESAAGKAQENFESTFSKGEIPDDVQEIALNGRELMDAVVEEGIVKSKTEYRRLEEAGAIKEFEGGVYKIGKRRFIRVK